MISFIIPAYNEAALVGACIRSITMNCVVPHEIIVVDNNSTDDTMGAAIRAGAIVILETRKGVTRARQAGFEAARFGIVAFIDADSEIPPGWVRRALEFLAPSNVVAVSGPVSYYELSLFKRAVSFSFYVVAKLAHVAFPMLQGGNFVVKAEALRRAGGFDTGVDFYGEDTNTAIRMSGVGRVVFSLKLWNYTSARRMTEEGLFTVGARYVANYVWMWLFGTPWSTEYRDHRQQH